MEDAHETGTSLHLAGGGHDVLCSGFVTTATGDRLQAGWAIGESGLYVCIEGPRMTAMISNLDDGRDDRLCIADGVTEGGASLLVAWRTGEQRACVEGFEAGSCLPYTEGRVPDWRAE